MKNVMKKFAALTSAAVLTAGFSQFNPIKKNFKANALRAKTIDYDLNGNGTIEENEKGCAFAIYNADELNWFSDYVNADHYANRDANAVLMDDIVLNRNVLKADGSLNQKANENKFANWEPIVHDTSNGFEGVFDGQNHTIYGLYHEQTDHSGGGRGLIGKNNGIIKNVRIEGSYFESSGNLGTICGHNNGIIDNCVSVSNTIVCENTSGGICGENKSSDAVIRNCIFNGTINTNNSYSEIGGIVGSNTLSSGIENCFSYGKINGISCVVGGVCGYSSEGIIENCGSFMNVNGKKMIGGVVGYANNATVKNSWSKGEVSGTESETGGICGYAKSSTTIENCFATGKLNSAKESSGGVIGKAASSKIKNCYYNSNNYSGEPVGENNDSEITNVKGRTASEFSNGTICELLSGQHSYIDGMCVNCGEFENGVSARLSGYSLSVGGIIGVNMYMSLGNSVLADNTAYVEFTLPNGTKEKVYVKDVKNSPENIDNRNFYIFTCNVSAKDIDKNIKAEVIYDNGSKSGGEYIITVAEYAKALKQRDASYSKFVDSMLLYGRYADAYFNNSEYNGAEYSETSYSTIASAIKETGSITNKSYIGSSLLLKERITIRHYFSERISNSTQKGDYWYIEETFNPTELNKTIIGYNYSINDYIKKALGGNAGTKLKNLCCALYEYSQAASELASIK